MKGPDFDIINYAMKDKDNRVIVTEESKVPNDNKVFKKIPMICEIEEIECIKLPQLLIKIDSCVKISIN